MSRRAFNVTGLSNAQIEERLGQSGLSREEQDALVEELSNRVTEELLEGRGASSSKDSSAGTHSFEPGGVGAPPSPPGQPFPKAFQHQPEPDREVPMAPAAPRRAPKAGRPGRPKDEAARRGFSRSLASLLALLLVAGGAWGVITFVNASGLGDPGGDPGGDGGSELGGGGGTGGGGTGGGGTGGGGTTDTRPATDAAGGPVGTARVDWVLDGVTYVARLRTNGPTGVADVTYVDAQSGLEVTVRESLQLERTGGVWHYTGSNPRDAATGADLGIVDYSPDIFFLKQGSRGWYFTRVCDTLGRCAEAKTTVA